MCCDHLKVLNHAAGHGPVTEPQKEMEFGDTSRIDLHETNSTTTFEIVGLASRLLSSDIHVKRVKHGEGCGVAVCRN
jgi:hypothetical protein